jgi:hypothetical protein
MHVSIICMYVCIYIYIYYRYIGLFNIDNRVSIFSHMDGIFVQNIQSSRTVDLYERTTMFDHKERARARVHLYIYRARVHLYIHMCIQIYTVSLRFTHPQYY